MKTIDFSKIGDAGNYAFRNDDIIILDSMQIIADLPDKELLIDGFLLVMIKRGHVMATVDDKKYNLKEGCVFVCNPNNIVEDLMTSIDLQVTGIFCTARYANWIMKDSDMDFARYALMRSHSVAILTDEQQNMVTTYITTIGKLLAQNDDEHKSRAILLLFHSMGMYMKDMKYMAGPCIKRSRTDSSHPKEIVHRSSAELIMCRFLEMLNADGYRIDNVNGYAKRLHVTPKYFSSVCKQVSGCTAGEILNEHLLREVKVLLRQPSLSIKQIALRMGFKNASHFGTWVRRNTGLSPQVLRNTM